MSVMKQCQPCNPSLYAHGGQGCLPKKIKENGHKRCLYWPQMAVRFHGQHRPIWSTKTQEASAWPMMGVDGKDAGFGRMGVEKEEMK